MVSHTFRRAHQGKIYFVKSAGEIKIGKTGVNPQDRLKSLWGSNASKCELLGVIDTNDAFKLEKELHKKFADKWSHGEWFYLDNELMKFIEDNTVYYYFNYKASNPMI